MNIKEIETKFLVQKFDGHKDKYLVFDKKVSSTARFVHRYFCTIIKHSAYKFYVEGFKPTANLDVLSQQVKDHVKSLPYDSEYYCPRFKAGLKEQLIIHDYLRSLGFDGLGDEFYVLKEKNVYQYTSQKVKLSVWGLSPWGGSFNSYNDKDTLAKKVRVVLHTGEYAWMEVEAEREVEAIKTAIDSLLKPLFVSDSVYNLEKSELLKNDKGVDMTLNVINKSLEHLSMDYKEVLKKKLLSMAEAL